MGDFTSSTKISGICMYATRAVSVDVSSTKPSLSCISLGGLIVFQNPSTSARTASKRQKDADTKMKRRDRLSIVFHALATPFLSSPHIGTIIRGAQ